MFEQSPSLVCRGQVLMSGANEVFEAAFPIGSVLRSLTDRNECRGRRHLGSGYRRLQYVGACTLCTPSCEAISEA